MHHPFGPPVRPDALSSASFILAVRPQSRNRMEIQALTGTSPNHRPPQNPGGANFQKPPQFAPPDFEPSPEPIEKEKLTAPSLKKRHARKTCATWVVGAPVCGSVPDFAGSGSPTRSNTPGRPVSRASLQSCSGAAPLNTMLESGRPVGQASRRNGILRAACQRRTGAGCQPAAGYNLPHRHTKEHR
jgi:hypothetical protein